MAKNSKKKDASLVFTKAEKLQKAILKEIKQLEIIKGDIGGQYEQDNSDKIELTKIRQRISDLSSVYNYCNLITGKKHL